MNLESPDGLRWSDPSWVLRRDEQDNEFDPYLQFYGLSIHPVGDLYLAFTWLYHSNEKIRCENRECRCSAELS